MNSGNAPTLEKKKIGTAGLVINGLAYLCPGCILMYYGVANQISGGAFPLALLVAGLVMIPTAMSYVKMSQKYPKGGSVYTYASKTMGYKIGFLVGWILILDYLFLGVTCALSSGIYMNAAMPSLPAWLGIVITVIIITVLCYVGIKTATIFNAICVGTPIILLGATIVIMCKAIAGDAPGSSGTFFSAQAMVNTELFNYQGFLTCVAVLCTLFVGYDAVTTMADQAHNPAKTIPRAVWIVCIYTVISFVIVGYLMNCAWMYKDGLVNDPDTAIYEFNAHLGADWFNAIFVPLNTLCSIGCSVTAVIAISNIFRVMAESGYLPKKFFAYVHPKFGTASRNVLLCGAISLVAILFVGNLVKLAELVSFGCLLSFAVTNAGVFIAFWIRDKRRGVKSVWSYIVLPFFSIAVNMFLWANLGKLAMIVGFGWLALGFVLLLIGTKGFKLKPEMDLDAVPDAPQAEAVTEEITEATTEAIPEGIPEEEAVGEIQEEEK